MTISSASRWLMPVVLGLGIVVFVLSSFPMMRPGFDVWWHLGVIEAPDQLDPLAFPVRRVLWHHFWHWIFNLLQIQDAFARALVIHRSQFLLTACSIALTGFLLLRVLTCRSDVDHASLLSAALLSTVIWMFMTGTRSTAHGGGVGAEVTQSWPLWYSVNYQISLPLVLLAMALLLSAVDRRCSPRARYWFGLGLLMAVFGAALVHTAELVYFLLFVGFVAALYLRGRHAVVLTVAFLVAGALLAGLALKHSYAVPRLLAFVLTADARGALDAMRQEGGMLQDAGLTRLDTGWHGLHLVSSAGLLLGICGMLVRHGQNGDSPARMKAGVAVLLTAAFPLGLMVDLGAGLFSFLTHTYIAWRFCFANLLFVGVPFAALSLSEGLRSRVGVVMRQMIMFGLVVMACGLAMWGENRPEHSSPGLVFAQSLRESLDPQAMYFGLKPAEQVALRTLAGTLRSAPEHLMLCADIFTSYYLFFLEHYSWVALPPALEYVPGYRKAESECAFPAENPALRSMGLSGVHFDSGP